VNMPGSAKSMTPTLDTSTFYTRYLLLSAFASRTLCKITSNPFFIPYYLHFRYDNVAGMEMEMPEKTTQDFDGPGMASRVDPVLAMGINDADDDENDITFSTMEPIANAFLKYGSTDAAAEPPARKPKKESAKGANRRPSSASKNRDDDSEEFKSNQTSKARK
jgi:hypothetical protein